jgi:hypothetical protein
MHTLILPYSESDTDIIAFIDRLRRRKKPFKIEESPSNPLKNEEDKVVMDWENCENAEYKLSMVAFADDWNAPENDHWDTY